MKTSSYLGRFYFKCAENKSWPVLRFIQVNVGVISFATYAFTSLTFLDNKTPSEQGDIIRNLQKIDGGTFTRNAIEQAYTDIFQPYYNVNPNITRNDYIILVSDTISTYGQDPCVNNSPASETLQEILDSGKFGETVKKQTNRVFHPLT